MTAMETESKKKADGLDRCMCNRELSWLKFNERVLEEANSADNPALERLNYISIFSSNLDEFYMIRVGSLTDQMLFAPGYIDNKTGMTAKQQLEAVFKQTATLYALKDRYYASVVKDLASGGVRHINMQELSGNELRKIEKSFDRDILPILSPQIIDNRHPFPHINNKQLHIAVTLERKGRLLFGLIAVPDNLERIAFLDGFDRFVLLEDIICHFCHIAFAPYKVSERTIIAVTRNADINTEEGMLDEDIDYRQFIQKSLKKRRRLSPVRLEVQYAASKPITSFFCEKLNLRENQLFFSNTPLNMSYVAKLEEKLPSELKETLVMPAYVPYENPEIKQNIMKLVQKRDVLVFYPFESFAYFGNLIRQAADDPSVLSIKITLYRLDSQSKLAENLIRAAENGKEVIVIMELRARFDEANNIEWARRLDEAGCRVIYGPSGYKVHSKVCQITKKEAEKFLYITQFGTGNYNEKTAKQYTDFSLITTNQELGKEVASLFHDLMLGSDFMQDSLNGDYSYLWVSPFSLKQNVLKCIDEQMAKALSGEDGRIIIKCNSLTDKDIIVKLIEASQSGVKISMIIRGICCLIPHIYGYTDNISVISIIGRFLEHSRVFCFGTGEQSKLYVSSADLMTRNTEKRVEVACPILDAKIKHHIMDTLETLLADDTKSWEMLPNSRYAPRRPEDSVLVDSQTVFARQAREYAYDDGDITAADAEQSAREGGMLATLAKAGKSIRKRLFGRT